MPAWPTVTLEDIAAPEKSSISKPYGSAFVQADYLDEGVPVVRGVNLASGRFRDDGFVFVSEALADTMPGARLQPGDLVFTHRGSIGQVSMIPRAPRYGRYAVSTSQVKVRLDSTRAFPEFYYYWFRSPLGQRSIVEKSSTVGVPGLGQPVASIKSLRVPLPPIETQRAIAATLGALDDKIESNRRAQQLGEQVMRSHVQLMLRNAQGREPATLSDFCSKIGEGVNQANLDSETAYVGLEMMPLGSLWLHAAGTTVGLGSDKSRFHSGDVLFGKLRPYFKKVAIAPVNGVCSTDILVLRPHEPQDLALVSVVASSDDLIESVSSSATGTRMPRTSWGDLASWPLPTPSRREREQLGAMAGPVIEGMLNLTRESHALATIRDCLLPELMAGRIRVISSEDPDS